MHTKESVETAIRESIFDVTGVAKLEGNSSLVGKELDINPVAFLYIFDILEKRLRLPVYDVFTKYGYNVMTVDNLATALLELSKSEH